MHPPRYVPPPHPSLFLILLGAALLSGCAALNPLQGVEPGPDTAWSRPARTTQAAPTTRPAPATSSAARPARRTDEVAEADVEAGPRVSAEAPILAGTTALSQHLRVEGADWLGTPYRYGGESRRGIDCSAFVQNLVREALGVELSRSTRTQIREGSAVRKEDLLPGDLVFFRRGGHVGVYLGDEEFIHSSSSNGVIVSRLDEGYYQRNYTTARRVVDDPRRFLLPADLAALMASARQAGARDARAIW